MDRERERFPLPRAHGRAVFQGHCHHHAVMGLDAELAVLARLGLAVERPDSGCCGMAGSFGFERGERHRVSVAAGERGILPAVRAAAKETLVLADGFSCREQIAQGTDRRALHLAEAIRLASAGRLGEAYPERELAGVLPSLRAGGSAAPVVAALAAIVTAAALGAAVRWLRGSRPRRAAPRPWRRTR
jgi:hypothetical protein